MGQSQVAMGWDRKNHPMDEPGEPVSSGANLHQLRCDKPWTALESLYTVKCHPVLASIAVILK